MPITYTGRLVDIDGPAAPSLIDIAIGLSRQPRFGGQTGRWWSVLDHSLFCDELVRAMLAEKGYPLVLGAYDDEESLRRCRLAVLLHDAHEALTGDVPTPLKTPDFKVMQQQLDVRIFDAFFPGGYGYYSTDTHFVVKDVDRTALSAEAWTFLPHGTEVISRHFRAPTDAAMKTLGCYLDEDYAANPPMYGEQEDHAGVQEYLHRMLELL
jgi:5'-deoxynucleotidase YfbR-like HD superfamily hydrolase